MDGLGKDKTWESLELRVEDIPDEIEGDDKRALVGFYAAFRAYNMDKSPANREALLEAVGKGKGEAVQEYMIAVIKYHGERDADVIKDCLKRFMESCKLENYRKV